MRTHVDLFSGIGGFALAAQANGVQTVQFCEIDERCRAFLVKAWPGVAIHDDVRTFDPVRFAGRTWLVTGGVPCQPASRAGKQRGRDDDRWLWPEAIRVISVIRPTWALLENPAGIGDVGLAGVLSDLAGVGYETRVFGIPACAVGAPHRRERYWIIGHRGVPQGNAPQLHGQELNGDRQGATEHRGTVGENAGVGLADAYSTGLEGADAEPRAHGLRAEHRASDRMADAELHGYGGSRGTTANVTGEHTFGKVSGESVTWANAVYVPCADGKFRRAPDDTQRMVDGVPVELLETLAEEIGEQTLTTGHFLPHRSLLGALGNSIVWPVAERIIAAMIDAEEGEA